MPTVTIALAKGRTADDFVPLWKAAGLAIPGEMDDSRALVFEVMDRVVGPLRFLLAKPVDVPTYVAFGVADVGVVGKDVIAESCRDVYELLDLEVAKCTLCVAGVPMERSKPPRRVATKYPRLADRFFRSRGVSVEVVPLGGSIELAAVIRLCDRIFDLVQTGSTLRANGLEVFEEAYSVSARFIANRASYRTKRTQIETLVERLQSALREGWDVC